MKKFHILLLICVVAVMLSIGATYYRSFISKDYLIQYETSCDPAAESCFTYECSEEDAPDCKSYTYKLMQKYANDLHSACGVDVRKCAYAASCTSTDRVCNVVLCDSGIDTCAVAETAEVEAMVVE